MGIGPTEMLLILLVVVLLFGASRLPQLGKSVGEGIKNFKRGLSGSDEEEDADEPEAAEKRRDRDEARRGSKRHRVEADDTDARDSARDEGAEDDEEVDGTDDSSRRSRRERAG